MDILERMRRGDPITYDDPEYPKLRAMIEEAFQITAELNSRYRDPDEVRSIMERLTGSKSRRSTPISANLLRSAKTCLSISAALSWTAAE